MIKANEDIFEHAKCLLNQRRASGHLQEWHR